MRDADWTCPNPLCAAHVTSAEDFGEGVTEGALWMCARCGVIGVMDDGAPRLPTRAEGAEILRLLGSDPELQQHVARAQEARRRIRRKEEEQHRWN